MTKWEDYTDFVDDIMDKGEEGCMYVVVPAVLFGIGLLCACGIAVEVFGK